MLKFFKRYKVIEYSPYNSITQFDPQYILLCEYFHIFGFVCESEKSVSFKNTASLLNHALFNTFKFSRRHTVDYYKVVWMRIKDAFANMFYTTDSSKIRMPLQTISDILDGVKIKQRLRTVLIFKNIETLALQKPELFI